MVKKVIHQLAAKAKVLIEKRALRYYGKKGCQASVQKMSKLKEGPILMDATRLFRQYLPLACEHF